MYIDVIVLQVVVMVSSAEFPRVNGLVTKPLGARGYFHHSLFLSIAGDSVAISLLILGG
jgi:hypothetical protein